MSYSSSVRPGGGLHPILHVEVDLDTHPSCPLYLSLSAPPSFIIDRFQLAQLHHDGRLGDIQAILTQDDQLLPTLSAKGYLDLEQPVIRAGPSSLLLQVSSDATALARIEVDIPMHLRYQRPSPPGSTQSDPAGLVNVALPWPHVFWLCSKDMVDASQICPLDASAVQHLDNFEQFSPQYLQPRGVRQHAACKAQLPPPHVIQVPTGALAHLALVEKVNTAVVWSMAALLAFVLFKKRPQAQKVAESSSVTKRASRKTK
ncbi:hypothetical protein ACM66B_004842 [Microbotryomycetes sp. NB124-2]